MTARLTQARKGRFFQRLGLLSLLFALAVIRSHAQQSVQEDPSYQAAQQQPVDGSEPAAVSPSADPPSRVARLSVAQGNVSVEPASVNEFSPAQLNDPLTTGDRVWADNGAVAELESGQMAVRMGVTTDLTVTAMTDTLAQFGLAQGSVHLRTFALDPGTTTELDTPNVAVTVLQPGDVRVDVDPNSDTTTVSLVSGEVEVDGNDLQQTLEPGQRVKLSGSSPVSAQWLQPTGADGLDNFSTDRDQAYESAESAEQGYLNPDTVGGADLDQNGSWSQDADYGEVWYPNVAAGWQPYCYGSWTWVAPWGWTWVESEPWGFAPFHYGRWVFFGGRWGWIPGPPIVRPVYSPALVVFIHPGSGLSAWFPLGPNEPYAPWYHASALYLNRVNVSNIYSRNAAQVRAVYQTANREVYANPLGAQQHFANRAGATVAVSQASFAAGRPVGRSAMRLSPEQIAAAPVLPHPMVTPERSMVVPSAARAVPRNTMRPVLASRENNAVRPGVAGTRPSQPAAAGAGQPAPIERRDARGTRTEAPSYAQPGTAQSGAAQPQSGARSSSGIRGTEQLPQSAAPSETPAQQRPLYNRAVPPPARPSFDQQRQAIQSTDPGRPLSPQQLNNLREDRPVGQPQVREAAPHPAPAPRSERAPRSSAPPAPPAKSNGKH